MSHRSLLEMFQLITLLAFLEASKPITGSAPSVSLSSPSTQIQPINDQKICGTYYTPHISSPWMIKPLISKRLLKTNNGTLMAPINLVKQPITDPSLPDLQVLKMDTNLWVLGLDVLMVRHKMTQDGWIFCLVVSAITTFNCMANYPDRCCIWSGLA